MPAKKKTKKAKKSPAEDTNRKEYSLITLEEVRSREIKYNNRLADLRTFLNYIDDAHRKVQEDEQEAAVQEKWENYVNCDPLPKPYMPQDIRLFFAKLRFFEGESVEKNIDWLLSVDECSILTQNIFRRDLTRSTLCDQLRLNFGDEYHRDISLALKILKRIEYFLEDDVGTHKATPGVLPDIKKRKIAVQSEIQECFDRYTYRILCSDEAYMDGPHMIADLHEVQIILQIPFSVLRPNLTVRALHMNFDHVSEYAKSFQNTAAESIGNCSSVVPDLYGCLVSEWLVQTEIQTDVRNKMIQRRKDYEEKMRELEEESKKKTGKKGEKNRKPNTKVGKIKEPPVIGSDIYPEIWDDFLERDRKEFEHFKNNAYNPERLMLDDNEINLRRYFILGGIYQLYYISKPKHYDFDSYNMTWHESDGRLIINKEITISMEKYGEDTTRTGIGLSNVHEGGGGGADVRIDPDCPWFALTFRLPEYLCLWGEPVPCHFESSAKVILPTVTSSSQPPAKTVSMSGPSTTTTNHLATTTSRTVHSVPSGADRSTRSPQRSPVDQSAEVQLDVVNADDFMLNCPLTKPQIRHLERHCVPRIISSFKFPKEIKEEELEEIRNKPKGKGGTLVRRQTTTLKEESASNRTFSYNVQNNPERLFPVYNKEESFPIPQVQLGKGGLGTFYELMTTLDRIKNMYKSRVKQTLDFANFKSKMIKPLLKQTEEVSAHQYRPSFNKLPTIEKRRSVVEKGTKSTNIKGKEGRRGAVSQAELHGRKSEQIERGKEEHSSQEGNDLQPDYSSQKEPSSEFAGKGAKLEPSTCTHSHWTREHIVHSEYNREAAKVTIITDRLGIFGFAFKRFEHFPFRFWSIEPSQNECVLQPLHLRA